MSVDSDAGSDATAAGILAKEVAVTTCDVVESDGNVAEFAIIQLCVVVVYGCHI